jgi:hypothetical protein
MNTDARHGDETSRPWQFSLRTLFACMSLVSLFLATEFFGITTFRYPRAFENDPLIAPIGVAMLDGDEIRLTDGRVLRFIDAPDLALIEQKLNAGDHRVDIEEYEAGRFIVYVKERGWICGTPWARLISIPLIPQDVPINHRVQLWFASVEPQPESMTSDKN